MAAQAPQGPGPPRHPYHGSGLRQRADGDRTGGHRRTRDHGSGSWSTWGERTTKRSAIAAAGMNPRMVRVTKDRWGLDAWGMPGYTGTAQTMRLILEEEGGLAEMGEVIRAMDERFGVGDSTVRSYAKAPIFIRYGKWIRLRREEDRPFQCGTAGIQRAPGVFDLGPGRLGRAVWVTEDTLRGSGSNLKKAAGGVLGMKAGDRLEFQDRPRRNHPG